MGRADKKKGIIILDIVRAFSSFSHMPFPPQMLSPLLVDVVVAAAIVVVVVVVVVAVVVVKNKTSLFLLEVNSRVSFRHVRGGLPLELIPAVCLTFMALVTHVQNCFFCLGYCNKSKSCGLVNCEDGSRLKGCKFEPCHHRHTRWKWCHSHTGLIITPSLVLPRFFK